MPITFWESNITKQSLHVQEKQGKEKFEDFKLECQPFLMTTKEYDAELMYYRGGRSRREGEEQAPHSTDQKLKFMQYFYIDKC